MTSEFPLVSIGIPVFNEEKTIARALDSLLTQSFRNFEIIVSDNCSTDKTAEICKIYAKKHDRIKLNLNMKNLGIIANFQIVHRKASGKYFMWAAGDDYRDPECLKRLVNELELDPAAGVAFCAVRRENTDGSLKDIIRFDGRNNPNRLSHWQLASRLLSPRKKIRLLKYNQFIYGLFRYDIIDDILAIEDNILTYGDRTFVALAALACRFRYVDQVLFYKTVKEPFRVRHPNESYRQPKKENPYLEYYLHYYYKLSQYIIKCSKIPLKRKFFVLFLFYWMSFRYMHKQKKKMRKLFYGKNA